MIEGIGEVSVQKVSQAAQQAVASNHQAATRETARKAETRPVEKTTEPEKERDETKKTSRYNLDHKFPVFERYDKGGELILQLPPVHDDVV